MSRYRNRKIPTPVDIKTRSPILRKKNLPTQIAMSSKKKRPKQKSVIIRKEKYAQNPTSL
jgi:hypothetical protein